MVRQQAQHGFTLIEMLVVVAIIAIVSSVVLFNYSDFSTNVSVRNLAQEIALNVRKAQVYATSVHTLQGTNVSSETFPGYGIAFSTSPNTTSDPVAAPTTRQFIIFVDDFVPSTDPSWGFYQQSNWNTCGAISTGAFSSSSNECLESIKISTADKISALYVYDSNNNRTQIPGGSEVAITFYRPNPDAEICATSSTGKKCGYSHAVIELQSAKGLTRSVDVWNTGQVSVE